MGDGLGIHSDHSQLDLDNIAFLLNDRPDKPSNSPNQKKSSINYSPKQARHSPVDTAKPLRLSGEFNGW